MNNENNRVCEVYKYCNFRMITIYGTVFLLSLLLLSSSSSSPLCRVFILIFLRQTVSPREYSVAAILLLLFMVLISFVSVLNLLYFYISTFRSMCAVHNMAAFWSSLTSCFPAM